MTDEPKSPNTRGRRDQVILVLALLTLVISFSGVWAQLSSVNEQLSQQEHISSAQHHYSLGHLSNSDSGFTSFLGAFFGAFLAFIFGLITYILTKKRERFVLHRNALVKLERTLNKHLHDIGVLEQVITDSHTTLGRGHVTSNRLIKLEVPVEIESALANIELINKLFNYQLTLDRINFNSETTNHSLGRLEDMFLSGQPPHTTNFNIIRDRLASMSQELPGFNEGVKRFLVLIRLHIAKLKDKNTFTEGAFHSQWDLPVTPDESREESAKLEGEIAKGFSNDF
jgi:hypothetical protein